MSNEQIIENLQKVIETFTAEKNWHGIDQCYNELNKFVDRTSESILAHAIAVHNDDPPRAATMLRKALRMAPNNNDIKHHLGEIYLSQKRFDEAEKVLITDHYKRNRKR